MAKPTIADWRKQVDKELAGAAFDTLVTTTPEGLQLQPLYTETRIEPGLPGAAPFTRGGAAEARPFQICMRVDPAAGRRPGALAEDLDGGADALWVDAGDAEAIAACGARGVPMIIGHESLHAKTYAELTAAQDNGDDDDDDDVVESDGDHALIWSSSDWIDAVARGVCGPHCVEPQFLRALAPMVEDLGRDGRPFHCIRVSSLAFHDAGADAADELALMLASAATYLRALIDNGVAIDLAVSSMWAQIAVGRDTFGELCKLRALRVVWHKLMSAAGAKDTALTALHAVCSARTQSARDPWVNMLRASTQVFAAALGGAQLITPLPFDEVLGAMTAHGRRVARNTALVLREESHLGRVVDAAGGAYYIEERTDALAREAWQRFTQIERDGGICKLITSGGLRERLARSWAAFAARKEPVLGVSEFVNADEALPVAVAAAAPASPALVPHRDDEAFTTEGAR